MQKTKDPIEISKVLRELRGVRTRTGVAKEIGISYSMLTKIEDGIRTPSDDLQKRIANYYGVPVENIFYTAKYAEK